MSSRPHSSSSPHNEGGGTYSIKVEEICMNDITSSNSISALAAKLTKAQAAFKPVTKSGENLYDRYKYALLEDYVSSAREVLAAHGLSIATSVLDVQTIESRTTKGGTTEHAVRVKIALRLLHESGEWIETASWGEGQDRADKAVYKAITGARKYGLAALLGLATTDDPEADESVGTDDAKKAVKAPATPPSPEVPSESVPAIVAEDVTSEVVERPVDQKVITLRGKAYPIVLCKACQKPIDIAAHVLWIEQEGKAADKAAAAGKSPHKDARTNQPVSWNHPVHPPGNCK